MSLWRLEADSQGSQWMARQTRDVPEAMCALTAGRSTGPWEGPVVAMVRRLSRGWDRSFDRSTTGAALPGLTCEEER